MDAFESLSTEEQAQQTRFFIHDLRVEKFFHQLAAIHEDLAKRYEKHNLMGELERHRGYIARLRQALDAAQTARLRYEVVVQSKSPAEEILVAGRAYIEGIMETCRISLLPHWRNFKPFLEVLPEPGQARTLEGKFNEVKTWIAAIDRRTVDFVRFADREEPMIPIAVATRVRSYVEEYLRFYVRGASEKRLEVRLGDLEDGMIYADTPRFNRLLFNLAMNAVDAMRHRRAGIIRFSVQSTEHTVTVEVADEGVGMTAERVEDLLHAHKDLAGELHSLGFVFVRQTVRDFKGKIDIDSTVDVGTQIRLVFPRYRVGDDALAVPSPEGPAVAHADPPAPAHDSSKGVDGWDRVGAIVVEDYCQSLAPLPGCLFSVGVEPSGRVDHFVHRPYDPDWMMGHDDLAPMLYEAVVRGRYEVDEEGELALILKAPLDLEEYWDLRDSPGRVRVPEIGMQMIHDELVRVGAHLIATGMDPETRVYMTHVEPCFVKFGQSFSAEPFELEELAGKEMLAPTL